MNTVKSKKQELRLLFRRRDVLCVILMIVLFGCTHNNIENKEQATQIDTIVWKNFTKKKVDDFPAAETIKQKKYINLFLHGDYLFGVADKVVFQDNIYILDRKQKKIVVFDQQGKGLFTLDNIGQGPEEYLQITDFYIDDKGSICMIDGMSDKLMIYNSKGQFISSQNLPFEADIIYKAKGSGHIFGLSTWNRHPQTKSKRFAITDFDLNIVSSFIDYDDNYDDSYWISYYRFLSNGAGFNYNKPIDDMVYTLSPEGRLEKAYYFDFGRASIPAKWRKDVESYINKIKEGYVCLKNHAIVTDRYIIGTLWDKTETHAFIADLNLETVYTGPHVAEADVSDFVDYTDNCIISLIYPDGYKNISKKDLPKEVTDHLAKDHVTLCISELL